MKIRQAMSISNTATDVKTPLSLAQFSDALKDRTKNPVGFIVSNALWQGLVERSRQQGGPTAPGGRSDT